MAVDSYVHGAPGSRELRAKARQMWEDFRETILQKKSVCQRRQLLGSLLTQFYKFSARVD